jgi:signal transduction histidine kinase
VRWLWPAGLAGRITLVLGVMLIGVQLVTLPFFLRQQSAAAEEIFQGSTVDRIAAIIALFEPLGPQHRRELLPAVSSPFLTLDMFYRPTAQDDAGIDEPELAANLSARLQREVIIKQVGEESGPLPALLNTRQQIAIWVPLADNSWLRFSTRSALPSTGWVVHMSAQLALVCLVLVLFSLVAARQIARPVRTLVAAVERLGTDVNAPPIPERGSRELRRISRVFNTMQGRLQRYVDDRTRMLAAISHDLRTSLTRLRLRTQFIDDPEQQRKAEHDLEQMDAMLASTLAFARDDVADEQPLDVDLAKLLHTLCDDLVDLGHRVEYSGPEAYTLCCRPVALRRAISNVLNNAVNYGGCALVSLEVGEGSCNIQVCDEGPGVPEDQLETIFEPFVRLDPARSRSTGGTGLGLSIARSVIRSHGGDILVANRAGGGLSVTLRLADLEG